MAEEQTANINGSKIEDHFRGYALYTYNANRPGSPKSSEKIPEELGEESVADFLSSEATSNHDFSLSLLSTDLTGDQDTELRTFIAKRLAKGTVYSGSGNVATVDNVLPDSSACQCYYCLLRGGQESEDSAQELADIMSLGGYLSKDFVVCFVADSKSELEFKFQRELDMYSRELLPELMTPIESLDVKEQFGHLKYWYRENVSFLCRCATLLQEHLAMLIQCVATTVPYASKHLQGEATGFDNDFCFVRGNVLYFANSLIMSLLGAPVKVLSEDKKIQKDIQLFVDACSTVNTSNALTANTVKSKPNSTNDLDILPRKLTLTVEGDTCATSSDVSTPFCKHWMKTMLSGDINDPVFLRQVIENYKLRVNQDMNTLKRLLRQAETDHYALYRSYQFLLQSGNGPILLQTTTQEAHAAPSEDTLEILKVLEDYIKTNNKFTLNGS